MPITYSYSVTFPSRNFFDALRHFFEETEQTEKRFRKTFAPLALFCGDQIQCARHFFLSSSFLLRQKMKRKANSLPFFSFRSRQSDFKWILWKKDARYKKCIFSKLKVPPPPDFSDIFRMIVPSTFFRFFFLSAPALYCLPAPQPCYASAC